MNIQYESMKNTEDIYALFNELEKEWGLRYIHSGPDPMISAQRFESLQNNHKMLFKEEDGRNLQYKGFLLEFESSGDCDEFFNGLREQMGYLKRFPCVYCRTGERSCTVIFNTVDQDGHVFGEFEEKRFMSLFK